VPRGGGAEVDPPRDAVGVDGSSGCAGVDWRRVVRAFRGQGAWDSMRSQREAGGAEAMRESPRTDASAAQPVSGRYLPTSSATPTHLT
jgi:hypothetical protein